MLALLDIPTCYIHSIEKAVKILTALTEGGDYLLQLPPDGERLILPSHVPQLPWLGVGFAIIDSPFSKHSISEILRTAKDEPPKSQNFWVQLMAVKLSTICERK